MTVVAEGPNRARCRAFADALHDRCKDEKLFSSVFHKVPVGQLPPGTTLILGQLH